MNRLSIFLLVLFMPAIMLAQTSENTIVKTKVGEVKIPGTWQEVSSAEDSGQTHLINREGVVIAVARNPMRAYPFYNKKNSAFQNVKAFHKWDADFRAENNFKVGKLKENAKSEYVIWKYNDGKLDNIFLFGATNDNFLNLLVYTDAWDEDRQIKFLEDLYKLNK